VLNKIINNFHAVIKEIFSSLALVNVGIPAEQSYSIASPLSPVAILKNPCSPQYVPHEFLPIQYSSPVEESFPHPTTEIS
jgi:hypothetical protein